MGIKLWDILQYDSYPEFFSLDYHWYKIPKQHGAFNITSGMADLSSVCKFKVTVKSFLL